MSRSRSKSTPPPGHEQRAEERDQNRRKEGREEARQDGRHVLDHALLGLDQPGGDEDGAGRSARQQPRLDERLGVDPDALEEHHHERREDAAAERDQHVVDEELPGEADEVHAALDLAPAAAGVRDPHDQPERDRQVQRRQRLGGALRLERIDVGEDGGRDERRRQPTDRAGIQPSFPREVAGQQGQDEETQVAGVELGVLVQLHAEERRHLDGHGRRHRERERDDGVRPRPPRCGSPLAGGRHDQLLPEAIRVLARELPREGVELAHALHRHQERLVGGEPRVGQHRDLLAQMVLQLRDVDGVDRLPAAEVAPPLVDLLLELHRVDLEPRSQAPCAGSGAGQRPGREAPARCRAAWRRPPATACVPRRAAPCPREVIP